MSKLDYINSILAHVIVQKEVFNPKLQDNGWVNLATWKWPTICAINLHGGFWDSVSLENHTLATLATTFTLVGPGGRYWAPLPTKATRISWLYSSFLLNVNWPYDITSGRQNLCEIVAQSPESCSDLKLVVLCPSCRRRAGRTCARY